MAASRIVCGTGGNDRIHALSDLDSSVDLWDLAAQAEKVINTPSGERSKL